MKISIIIPVFNTKPYLRQCLDSLLRQSLKEIEIICVDNGSTDGCLDILKEYEAKNANISVLQHPIGRQGDARNVGIKIAKGEYIGFVDSDDFVKLDMFELMYNKAKINNADIAVCDINLFYNSLEPARTIFGKEWFPCDDVFNIKQYKRLIRNTTICNKIYKRAFVKENDVSFAEGVYHEDVPFVIGSYLLANRIVACPEPLYFYRKGRIGSVNMNNSDGILMIFPAMAIITEFLKSRGLQSEYGQDLSEFKIYRYLNYLDQIDRRFRRMFYDKIRDEFQRMDISLPIKLLTPTEFKNYRIIINYNYLLSLLIFSVKQTIGYFIGLPFIGYLYKALRRYN